MSRYPLPIVVITAVLSCVAACSAQDTNFSQGPQYLMNYGSPHFLHPIQTPSLDLSAPRAESPNAPATEHTGQPDSPGFGGLLDESQVDQVYYGVQPNGLPLPPSSTVVEIVLAGPASPAGSAIFNAGVGAIANSSSLHDQGYGVSLAEDAAYWRAHKPHAARVYTNADIERLHGG